eukprot:TRINITY_DN4427_c0_g1_i1.p1 TRINITY_DN4427_c0_g1~~TRINITY_DN4427_c0_g1_i1.p1  ORF type:complete len:214 (-),score=51.29 TRINITY_DN4427_c0_g1_i1:102-716(-)
MSETEVKSDNSSTDTQPLCVFFQKGKCTFGSRCRNMHVYEKKTRDVAQTKPCDFFLKGACKFGTSCRLLHDYRKAQLPLPLMPNPVTAPSFASPLLYSQSALRYATPFMPITSPFLSAEQQQQYQQQQQRQYHSRSNRKQQQTTVCSYFLKGQCKYGTSCRFKHPSSSTSSSTVSTTASTSSTMPSTTDTTSSPSFTASTLPSI